jgi:ppGpp synthetase/RelA/SpoT-type nucleotidyltranferase
MESLKDAEERERPQIKELIEQVRSRLKECEQIACKLQQQEQRLKKEEENAMRFVDDTIEEITNLLEKRKKVSSSLCV